MARHSPHKAGNPPTATLPHAGDNDLPGDRIRLKAEFLLDREGIVIASYLDYPKAAFGLTEQSRLAGCAVAHLTLARTPCLNGQARKDLVTLRLVNAADVKTIVSEEIWLEGIEIHGYFPQPND